MKHYIYCIKNKINNKMYIGQTNNIVGRWSQHIHLRKDNKNMYIDKAINKYGKDNFEFTIIEIANSQEEADKLEKEYINKFNTIKPFGYNLLKGGRNQQGAWNSKKILVYDLNAKFIGEFENAVVFSNIYPKYNSKGIRDCCMGKTKRYKDLMFYYKNNNNDIKPYINTKNKDKIKKIYQFDLEGNFVNDFNSITEASKKTNTSRTSIIGCCKGYYKTANNYLWSYNKNIKVDSPNYQHLYKIKQIDESGNIVNIFYNCKEAEEKLHFKKNTYKMINKRLNSNKMYNGYYWVREDLR